MAPSCPDFHNYPRSSMSSVDAGEVSPRSATEFVSQNGREKDNGGALLADKHEEARVCCPGFSFLGGSVLVAACSVGDGVEEIVCGLELAAVAVTQGVLEYEGLLAALVAVAYEGELAIEDCCVSGGYFVADARVEDGDSCDRVCLRSLEFLVGGGDLLEAAVGFEGLEDVHRDGKREVALLGAEEKAVLRGRLLIHG